MTRGGAPTAGAPAPFVLVAHCRGGFEAEAGIDLERIADTAGTSLQLDAPTGRGFVVGAIARYDAARFERALGASAPVFVRSMFVGNGPHGLLEPAQGKGRPDRVTPLAALADAFRAQLPLRTRARAFCDLWLETAHTNEGKELSGLCRALEAPLRTALEQRGALDTAPRPRAREPAPRLHVLFADGAHVYLGASVPPWGSAWPMGIPRLRMPREAPSRSTLKLAEAIERFLGEEASIRLRPGMHAVDLGAAPGGWTWQLAYRGLKVVAVDNGPLKGEVARDDLVTHLRVDGLSYRPRRPVDWMVCDIAEQPSRIAALVARWMVHGDARRIIFNLKLPMKKRYDEVLRCRAILEETLARAHMRHTTIIRQLYHDREEVTGYCARVD